jgi:hypothetical protein
MTVGELGEFCLNNSNLPGEELPNQAFVLDYVIFDSTDPDTLNKREKVKDKEMRTRRNNLNINTYKNNNNQ